MLKTLCLCLVLVLAAGCARTGGRTAHGSDVPQDASAVQGVHVGDALLAEFVGNSQPGASGRFENTSFGPAVTVTAGSEYWCGLGTPCRKANAVPAGGVPSRIAVCKIDGVWQAVHGIFLDAGRTVVSVPNGTVASATGRSSGRHRSGRSR